MARSISCPVCGEEKNFYTLFVAEGNRGADFISSEHTVVLCKTCGLCFLNPQHEEKDYARYYEFFDRPVGKKIGPRGFRPNSLRGEHDRIRLDFLTQFLPYKKAKIVDIGSGYGLFLKGLAERGYTNLYGCEPNIEAARNLKENFGFRVLNAALGDASLPKEEFDAVTLVAVVEHFTAPIVALRHIYNLLKPGGIFYVNTPNLLDLVLRAGWNKFFKFVHTFYFTDKSLKNILRRAGFEILASYTLPSQIQYAGWLSPERYSSSELNIVARRPLQEVVVRPAIERENWQEIKTAVDSAWRRDRYYNFSRRVISFLRFRRPASFFVRRLDQKARTKNPLQDINVPRFTST